MNITYHLICPLKVHLKLKQNAHENRKLEVFFEIIALKHNNWLSSFTLERYLCIKFIASDGKRAFGSSSHYTLN